MLARKSMTATLQAFLPNANNGCHYLIMVEVCDFSAEHLPVISASKIMKLSDYHVAAISQSLPIVGFSGPKWLVIGQAL